MNKTQFIEGIQGQRNSSIKAVIKSLISPSGRSPSKKDRRISDFYNKLSEEDRKIIYDIVEWSSNMSFFSFLCILDHVTFIEDDENKTEFELYATKDGKRVLINTENEDMLHDLFNDWAGDD